MSSVFVLTSPELLTGLARYTGCQASTSLMQLHIDGREIGGDVAHDEQKW